MKFINSFCSFLLFLGFCNDVIAEVENDFELDEDNIPIIESDGGIIKTAVEDGVLVLNKDNFHQQVMTKSIILVEFYAPWCGHCKSLEPEYAKAAKILSTEEKPIALAKVDATVESELAAQYEVTGYPTILLFQNGEKTSYEGPRTASGIVEYMKERADPNFKPPPDEVINLTSENFEETVENAPIILVEFYAPWCGHCKQLAPEYERAARTLKNLPTPVLLAKVDGIKEKELAEKYEARGWPTLMIFRNGRKYAYEGPRDEIGIVEYMKNQAKPPSTEIKSITAVKTQIKTKTTIVGFFDSNTDAFYNSFIETANTLREKYTFYHSFYSELKQHFELEKALYTKPVVLMFLPEIFSTPYEPPYYAFTYAEATSDDISTFIRQHTVPLVGHKTMKNYWMYEDKYPLVVVYYDVDFGFDYIAQTQLVRKEVAKAANDYKDKITFAVANEEEFQEELKLLNLDSNGEDVSVGYFESAKVRYRMEPVEDFSADELTSFVKAVLAGKVPKHIKSQPKPKSNKGPVKVVVGSTFDELVTKNKKDVFIEFYAPWCGHCKKLDPIYKKLAKSFEDNENVDIVKIDATANDYPSIYDVKGFPTLYYLPAKQKRKPVLFSGERNLKDLANFVNDQLSAKARKEEL